LAGVLLALLMSSFDRRFGLVWRITGRWTTGLLGRAILDLVTPLLITPDPGLRQISCSLLSILATFPRNTSAE
jgi:hypothetical protein